MAPSNNKIDVLICDYFLVVCVFPMGSYLTFLRTTPVGYSFKLREEPVQLLLPVVKCGGWGHHKKRAPNTVGLSYIGQEGQGLNCFTETHLVSEDSVNPLVVEGA